jgi:glycosyltransferase involved in cell wall biosynthesis
MSRIGIDARELRTSSGRYIERLIHYLQEIDTENEYFIFLKPADMEGWQPTNPNFKKLACPYKEFTFAEQLGFKKQLDSLNLDLVHFPMAQQPAFYKGKTITTINDLTTTRFRNYSKNRFIFRFKQLAYIWLNHRIAKKSSELITFTKFVKDDFINFSGVSPSKITVIYLAADEIESKSEPLPNLAGKEFLFYVGRPISHKNLERLVEAFAKLKPQFPNLKLVLAGKRDANYERLEALVKMQSIKDVDFLGYITEGNLRWLYENCQAYVFPSLSEGFGLPGLEAMLHSAPVVSSSATCLPEIYGDAAHYFDPLDTESMTKAINEVLGDVKLRAELITKGAQQVSKYSWLRLANQTLEIYKRVLDK